MRKVTAVLSLAAILLVLSYVDAKARGSKATQITNKVDF